MPIAASITSPADALLILQGNVRNDVGGTYSRGLAALG